jgi:hypothetical protein
LYTISLSLTMHIPQPHPQKEHIVNLSFMDDSLDE